MRYLSCISKDVIKLWGVRGREFLECIINTSTVIINTLIVSSQHERKPFLRQNFFQEVHLPIGWLDPNGL